MVLIDPVPVRCLLLPFYSIVLVGGDGFYHEAVNGLQRRLAREQGLDYKDPNIGFARIPVPIGLIPAGEYSLPLIYFGFGAVGLASHSAYGMFYKYKWRP